MKFEGKLEDVMTVVDVISKFKQMADLSKSEMMGGQFVGTLSLVDRLKDYGEDLVSYAYLNKEAFIYRSIERNALLVEIKAYRLTITYVGARYWFRHFLKQVGLYELFDNVEIITYDPEEDIGFKIQPHHTVIEGFAKLPLDEQRTIIQKLVSKAAYNGEDGNFIHYGGFKTTEDEQGVGWFVIDSKYLKEDENSVIKHYFNSKENNIRVNTLKEFMALSKSIDRVRRHI